MLTNTTHLSSAFLFLITVAFTADAKENTDWQVYLGGQERNLYSSLMQINRDNVVDLQVAWTHETGDKAEYQANNLIVDGLLYTPTPSRKVVALDAATGAVRWTWDPAKEGPRKGRARQRGLVYWENEDGRERRLFTGVANMLFALSPSSGKVIKDFGEEGSIKLGSGLNTPGVTYKDLLIVGGLGGKGAVRAYDVRTGAQRWIFDLIPRPVK